MGINVMASSGDWMDADPDRLDGFADALDELAQDLEQLQGSVVDAASFRGPSTDPATQRAVQRLAEDGYDLPDSLTSSVGTVVHDLRQQALTARLVAADYRAREERLVERFRRAEQAEEEEAG